MDLIRFSLQNIKLNKRYASKILNKRYESQVSVTKTYDFNPIIGLEIHAQIWSQSKLFSSAPNIDDASLNSVVSLFDIATPGTLPRLNRHCVLQCLKAAVLFKCQIPSWCRFDRKHYFYPDMPSGYQITQQDHPIAQNGSFDFYKNHSYKKRVHIKQLQLETDSGKSLLHGDRHLIDLNRAGVGLIEIVTSPELYSADEAMALMEQIRLYLVGNKICMGDMFKGQMRADANVSLRKDGINYPRVEIKNINSINFLRKAITSEIERQQNILLEGGEIEAETRSLLDDNLTSKSTRAKGEALDYRILPEPNLPRLTIDPKWVAEATNQLIFQLPHLRYIEEYNMDPHVALKIVADVSLHEFVLKCIDSKTIASMDKFINWLQELATICYSLKMNYPPDLNGFPNIFAELVQLETDGLITKLTAIDLIRFYLNSKDLMAVKTKIEKDGLWRIKDSNYIIQMINNVLESHPKLVEKALLEDGKQKNFRKLRNEVILLSNKRISIENIENYLTKELISRK